MGSTGLCLVPVKLSNDQTMLCGENAKHKGRHIGEVMVIVDGAEKRLEWTWNKHNGHVIFAWFPWNSPRKKIAHASANHRKSSAGATNAENTRLKKEVAELRKYKKKAKAELAKLMMLSNTDSTALTLDALFYRVHRNMNFDFVEFDASVDANIPRQKTDRLIEREDAVNFIKADKAISIEDIDQAKEEIEKQGFKI